MRILVLGGTAFLSREVAEQAVRRGHHVVCAARGVSGGPAAGARFVRWDRKDAAPPELLAEPFDAVIDVARTPSYVRGAVASFPEAHWSFVSTANVYADDSVVGATAAESALREAIADDVAAGSPESYGGMKVACEQIVTRGAAAAFVVRPGLIVGPGDDTGRFAYWPAHAHAAAEDGDGLLVPGSADAPVQFIDVRDLAAWIVTAAESRLTGAFDGVGPAMPRADFLVGLAAGTRAELDAVYADTEWLLEHEVGEWMGPGSIPLWLGSPGYEGFMARDASPSIAAGLAVRPLADTVRDTLTWLRATPEACITGLTRAQERELLAALG